MAQTLNVLQVYQGKDWAGLTTDNHLGTIFQEQPYLASAVMTRVFGQYDYMSMDALLSFIGAEEEFPDDRDYEWYLKGDDEKAIAVVSYSASDTTRPGVNNTRFKIVFGEKWFVYTDLIVADNKDYRLRVLNDGNPVGTNWEHEVELMSGDPTLFVPTSLLAAGSHFHKDYSPQEKTLSQTGGVTSYTAPFKMRNAFGTIRKRDTIPGNMLKRPLVIDLLDPSSNKTTKIWTQYADWAFMTQWHREKNRAVIYGKTNRTSTGTYLQKGPSGFEIKEGSGLLEQISPSNIFNYTTFNINWLEDVMLELSIGRLPEDRRHFIGLCGERGMVQFHRALENKASEFQPLDQKLRVVGSGQNLAVVGQYKRFEGPQGVRFDLLKVPEYDNPVTNRIPHPDGGHTESYRYTILDIGTQAGKKNIRRAYPAGEKEKMWHIAGSCTPYGPNTSFKTGSASAVDGYEIHAMAKQTVIIENPMRCGELKYSITS